MDLQALCEQTRAVVNRTADFIRTERQRFSLTAVEHKGSSNSDMVSYVDKTAEQQLVAGLEALLPEAGFITEEGTTTRKGDRYNWIIDPLDGTTNFIHGLPCYCVSIALADGKNTVLGVVHEINLDECFYAWKGGGAYLNGAPIAVSTAASISDGLMAIGFPYTDTGQGSNYLQLVQQLQADSHGVRRLGSAAVDLVYVACGRLEAFVELGLNPWDVAGGAFIVQEAGGAVSDFHGGDDFVFGESIAATNGAMHAAVLEAIRKNF